jgi:hypothetical protein
MQYVERMDKSFYFYEGSLTTPPCTETVRFLVMNEIQYLTFSDIEQFQRFWGGNRRFANGRGNNRLIQPLNSRKVYFKEVTLEERYETLTNHFMMPASEDSGMLISVSLASFFFLALFNLVY